MNRGDVCLEDVGRDLSLMLVDSEILETVLRKCGRPTMDRRWCLVESGDETLLLVFDRPSGER